MAISLVRIEKHIPAHQAPARIAADAPVLELPFAERSKSRLRATLSNGDEAVIFLPRGTILRGGDVLQAEDGTFVAVRAAPEQVLVVTGDRLTLMRAAYHLGNRHVPVEVGEHHLKLNHDPVLADMLRQLGASVDEKQEPFEPESGAYGGRHRHGHDATFDEDYALAQSAFESRAAEGGSSEHHLHHAHPHGAPGHRALRYPPLPAARSPRSK